MAHVEVQAQKQKRFGRRVFVYNYRIQDNHDRPVASLVVLADNDPKWYVSGYEQELWECSHTFTFPSVKIVEYKGKWKMLETSSNPFAVLVMAHLRTTKSAKDKKNLVLSFKSCVWVSVCSAT